VNWDAIGAIGEIIGAIAVLVSLIFVGLQVRQSAAQTQKSNVLARADMNERAMRTFGDTAIELARIEGLASAFRKVMREQSEITVEEQAMVFIFFNVWLLRHRTAFLSVSEGLIDAQVIVDFDNTTRWYLTAPLFKNEWKHARRNGLFTGDFVSHVEGLIAPQ
jgi:hypothetical protein